jgi:ZIP family zinc transporter
MRGQKKQGDTFGSRGAYGGIRVLFRPNRKKGGMEMLQSLGWAAAGTGFTFLMTALGAATVFIGSGRVEVWFQKAVLGFAAGVMTAASVWSLLIPAIEQVTAGGVLPGWIPAAAGMLAGTVFLAGMDGLILCHRQERSLLMTAITLHNIPEGMAVGLAFALAENGEGLAGAVALAIGIGIQNFPEGAAIALPLRQQGCSRTKAFVRGMLSGSVEPVFGVLVVLAAASARAALPWFLSFAAGAMLYVAVEELIPQAHSRAGTCGFGGGFLIMMILDVALG